MSDVIANYRRKDAIEYGTLVRLEEYFARNDVGGILLDGLRQLREKAGRFDLGELVITANAAETLNAADVLVCLISHRIDPWPWVELDEEELDENERALRNDARHIFSAYQGENEVRFWIITECNGEATTVLLPEDY